MLKINRRQFITFAVAGGSVATASHFWLKQSKSEVNLSKQSSNPTQVYRSQNGLLEVDLEANYAEDDLGVQTDY